MDFNNRKETYLAVMTASLEKKSDLLDQLIELSLEQENLIKDDKINEKLFDSNIEAKDQIIKKIQELDDGFDKIYQNLKEELTTIKDSYREQIQKLQDLITVITDKGVRLQVIEKQNKARIEVYFSSRKREIRDFKLSNKTVSSYYKNMVDQHQQQSYFFDRKK